MKKLLNIASKALHHLVDITVKRKIAKRLLLLSDAQLEDVGLSRNKLLEGSSSYPWSLVTYTQAQANKADVILLNTNSNAASHIVNTQNTAVAA